MKPSDKQPRILIVDDDRSLRSLLVQELSQTFPRISSADSGARALAMCEEETFDVVLLDIRLPDRNGMEVLQELKSRGFDGEVIMLTGHAALNTAIESLKLGAYDYLSKPCNLAELESILQKAHEKRLLRRKNWTLQNVLDRQSKIGEFVGESDALARVVDMIRRVAGTDSTVLIHGESGVGKELVAQAIHRLSQRASDPFVVVDCTALHEELLQSELFGHERGAFTGALALKHGLFEVADGGTVFLDEIGDLPAGLQSKLLRVLEAGTFRRLGGVRDIRVDVRILAATNRSIEQMVRDGRFRDDLFYRVNVVSILVPPLRQRREDIPRLVEHFIGQTRLAAGKNIRVSPEALDILVRYSWPGNIRELQNVVERALILSDSDEIRPRDLPGNMQPADGAPPPQADEGLPTLKELERRYLETLLKRFSGHRGRIAATMGISERSLYRKLSEYGLERAPEN